MEDMKDGSHLAPHDTADDIKQHKLLAIIGYISILFLIPLIKAPKSPFAKFHGKQGLVLFLAACVVAGVDQLLPGMWALLSLVNLALLVLSVMGMVKASEGAYWEMPFLGQFAKKLNF
ncbi:MAG: hypothetical protein NUV56_00355 [Candidatus Uhrbacteria bacterium]|nr:hypothetical protein [Candidatus Uhrbacteria bacterium]